jgi:AcrR family transcriptional regulator
MTDAVREPRGASRARRRAPPEERRAQILEAALQCFASKGYHSATMDDLVRASGLSKGSLYWHFQSKEEVLLALFDAFAAEIFAAWEAAAEEDHDSLELLRREGEIAIGSTSRPARSSGRGCVGASRAARSGRFPSRALPRRWSRRWKGSCCRRWSIPTSTLGGTGR